MDSESGLRKNAVRVDGEAGYKSMQDTLAFPFRLPPALLRRPLFDP